MEACYICGNGPHERTALHVYTTDAEAEAWFAEQPPDYYWAPEADETLRFPGED